MVMLNDNRDFVAAYKKGRYAAGKNCVVYFRKNGLDHNRVGFTAGKKVGNAVKRNRSKRVMRKAFADTEMFFPKGLDIVIAARENTPDCKSYHIATFLEKCAVPKICAFVSGNSADHRH